MTQILGLYHEHYSIWALKPYYLGPWTLRDGGLTCIGIIYAEVYVGGCQDDGPFWDPFCSKAPNI